MPYLEQNDAKSTRHSLAESPVTIGRFEDNDIVLAQDMRASRHHAEFKQQAGEWYLRDLRSRNGTFLNGERVTESLLREGDIMRIGGSTFVFSIEQDPFSTVADTHDARLGGEARPNLSEREKEILGLLARGSTDQQISEALFISPATVRSHLDRIRDKTSCRRRPELTRLAIDLGLIE